MDLKSVSAGLLFLLTWSTPVEASLTESLDELIATLPPGSIHGIEVRYSSSGRLIYARNNTLNLLPASLVKVVTAITAYHGLGSEFRFKTDISSQRRPHNQHTYQGDLKITFRGDPSLTHSDLTRLIAHLKQAGISEIRGNIWLDNAIYSGYSRAGGTIWDDRNICFAAPSSAIILDRNCFFAWLKPAALPGHVAVMVYDQPGWHLTVDNQVNTRPPGEQEPLGCVQQVWPSDNKEYRLTGCIAPYSKPVRMAFSVARPERSAQRFIKSQLKYYGVTLKGQILVGKPKGDFTHVIASHFSEPLPALLKRTLDKSDNIYSDSILKMLGNQITGLSGSYSTGTMAVREILTEQGVLLERARLIDGSGLSRYNRLSAKDINDVLIAGWHLWGRKAPWLQQNNNPKRWLKSGYMSGVNNVAGYVFPGGRIEPLVFTIILNGLRARQPATLESTRVFHKDIRAFHRAFLELLEES